LAKIGDGHPRRQRIIAATFDVLMERGFAGASTVEIARRAKVSKRELYAEFGNKSGILEALVSATAERMRVPLAAADIADRAGLRAALVGYGITALTELTGPHVLAIHRLAAAEAGQSAELGKILDQAGRGPNRRALVGLMSRARAAGLVRGEPSVMSLQYFNLLGGDIFLRLLLGAIRAPRAQESRERAEAAADAVLQLHAPA